MAVYQQEKDNMTKWDGKARPFYETYYFRFFLPEQKKSILIRYSLLVPKKNIGQPTVSVDFLVFENPESKIALRLTVSEKHFVFDRDIFFFQAREASIYNSGLRGKISNSGHEVEWDLSYEPNGVSLYPYPKILYLLSSPKTKIVVPNCQLFIRGELTLDGEKVILDNVHGTQGHFWGTKHWERWAWCHIPFASDHTHAYFEAFSGQARFRHRLSPFFTLMILHVEGKTYYFNQLARLYYNQVRFDVEGILLEGTRGRYKLVSEITSVPERMIASSHTAMDGSKLYYHQEGLAEADVKLYERSHRRWRLKHHLSSKCCGAYELVERSLDGEVKLFL